MVEYNKIFELYKAMMNSEEFITTKEIKELGFIQSDITKMIEDGTLIRIKRGYYNIGNVNGLLDLYYMQLLV